MYLVSVFYSEDELPLIDLCKEIVVQGCAQTSYMQFSSGTGSIPDSDLPGWLVGAKFNLHVLVHLSVDVLGIFEQLIFDIRVFNIKLGWHCFESWILRLLFWSCRLWLFILILTGKPLNVLA